MSPVFFVSPCPLSFRAHRPQLSQRRPWPTIWATPSMTSSPPNNFGSQQQPPDSSSDETGSPSELGVDPQWAELAQQITPPASSSETPREAPAKWTYPDGDPRDVGPDNPWKIWESAIEREQNTTLTPRDVKAETDFWRGAARDLNSGDTTQSANSQKNPRVSENSQSQIKSNPFTVRSAVPGNDASQSIRQSPFNVSSSQQFNSSDTNSSDVAGLPSNDQEPSFSSSTDIWREARGVTAKMSSMQSELRQELDRYNPFESTDEYRQMARDLVGPANDEPWEDKDPVPVSDQSEVGSGWDPDVDWMRYDDVGREKALKDPSIRQRFAEDTAQPVGDTFTSDESFGDTAFGADVGPVGDNDGATDWKNYTDQRPSPGPSPGGIAGNNLPGFIRNRMMSGSTYGSGRANMQSDIDELRKRGVELRSPKDDTDAWRGIAKELKLDPSSSKTSENAPPPSENIVENLKESSSANDSGKEHRQDEEPDNAESDSWSLWQSSREKWDRVNKALEPRDPKKEVDAWRMSAKELLSGVDIPTEENKSTVSTDVSSQESDAWAKWRKSDKKWKEQVVQNEKESTRKQSDSVDFNNKDSTGGSGVQGQQQEGRVRRDQSVSAWLSFAKEVGGAGNDLGSSDSPDGAGETSPENKLS